MAKTDRPEPESPSGGGRGGLPYTIRHDFGYRLTVPAPWEVEYAPRASMEAGQVVYITPRGNVFYVSFGSLKDLKGRFASLDEYVKSAPKRLPTQGEVSGRLETVSEPVVSGHRAVISNFQGNTKGGGFVEVWVADVWCDGSDRWYSVYGEVVTRQEFAYFPRLFTSTVESLVCHGPQALSPNPGWQLADVGFSPRSKLWFVQLFDYSGLLEMYQSWEIVLRGSTGVQYQWPQPGPKPMWHIRERIFPDDLNGLSYDQRGDLVVEYKADEHPAEQVPDEYDSVTYAYSLSTSRGFVEFRDKDGKIIKRLNDRWIAVEGLDHRTVGVFPNIRLSAKKADVESVIVTKTTVVIQGKKQPA